MQIEFDPVPGEIDWFKNHDKVLSKVSDIEPDYAYTAIAIRKATNEDCRKYLSTSSGFKILKEIPWCCGKEIEFFVGQHEDNTLAKEDICRLKTLRTRGGTTTLVSMS